MLRPFVGLCVCWFFLILCALGLPVCERSPLHDDELPDGLIQERVVNLVYTMRSSCKMCQQQAARLPLLKRYLEKKGIKTHMIVGVSHSGDTLAGLLPRVRVNSRHVWRAMGQHNNHFYVIDRCGRMVFEIINPWSNLDFPFVRSAVVATQHNHPCGLCPADYEPVAKEEEKIVEYPKISESSEYIPEGTFPLKMVVKLRHTHKGEAKIYNHIVRVPEVAKYHGHLENDGHHSRKFSTKSVEVKRRIEETNGNETHSINSEISSASKFLREETRLEEDRLIRNSSSRTETAASDPSAGTGGSPAGTGGTSAGIGGTSAGTGVSPAGTRGQMVDVSKDYLEEEPPDEVRKSGRVTLTKEQIDEKEATKRHYKRILDWVPYTNDYE